MPIYEVEAPDGRILEIEGDQFPSEQELDKIFASVGSDKQPQQPEYKEMSLKEVFNATPDELNENMKVLGRQRLQQRADWEQAHPFISEIQKSFQPNYRADVIDMQNQAQYGLQVPFGQKIKSDIQKAGQNLVPSVNIATIPYTSGLMAGAKGLIPSIGRGMLQGGIQGGVEGLTGGIADEGLSVGALKRGLGGTGAGVTVGGIVETIPFVGKPLGKFIGNVARPSIIKGFAQNIGRISPETLQRVVNPESVALDLTKDQAQNLLMNTTEGVRNAYNDILSKRGQDVGNAIKNLRQGEYTPIKVDDIKKDITSIFNQYQGDKINPARNMTGNLENELLGLVESGRIKADELVDLIKNQEVKGSFNADKKEEAYKILSQATGKSKKWLKSQLGAKTQKGGVGKRQETISEMLENTEDRLANLPASEYNYYKPTGDTTDTDLARRAYDDVINNRFYEQASPEQVMFNELDNKYKDILDNFVKTSDFETASVQFDNLLNGLPDNIQKDFIEKFSNDIYSLNKSDTISPIDLQNMKTQVGKMINWSDETSKQYKNPILEQLYGKLQGRLSELSPELAQANKNFANVANFKKNEGLKRILKAGDNIDTASSALKNYNSTVTKGNVNRNIQDLENLLVNEGYEPFLNKIDDVNAAMDLLGMRTTGDSIKANLAVAALRPLLNLSRGLNRRIPQMKILKQNIGRTIKPTAIPLSVPLLQGGVVYNDYR